MATQTRSRHRAIIDHGTNLTVKPCLSTWPEIDTQGSTLCSEATVGWRREVDRLPTDGRLLDFHGAF
jgi:hypothetical protein